jgi:tetratricopeptide (TPR) repeat protein
MGMPRYFIPAAALIFLFPVLACAQPMAVKATPAQVQFAQKFAGRILSGQQDAAAAMFDGAALMSAVEANIAAPPSVKKDFDDAAHVFSESIVKSLIDGARKGNSFKFIRCRRRGSDWVAIYRKRGADGATDYLEFYLQADKAGDQHFVDTFDLAQGSRSTETLRRIYLDAVIKQDKNAVANVGAKEREMMDNADRVQEMTTDVTTGKFQAALDIYKKLPASVQHDKHALHWRVMALDQLGEPYAADYKAAIEDCQKYLPNDPSMDFLALDHFLLQKQFKQAHEALDRLAAYTGDDGNWHFMHGNIYTMSGVKTDRALAIGEYKKALAIEPDFDPTYWSLITVYLQDKKYADVATTLTAFQHNTGREVADLTTLDDYADFVQSPEGKAWIAQQKKAAPTTQP